MTMQQAMTDVKVDIEKGMFSSEVLATLHTIDGNHNFFVSKDKIAENAKGEHLLQCHLVQENKEKGLQRIALPLYVECEVKRIHDIQKAV
jgi:NRPS condensation-like uncharacterized protein